MSGTLFPIVVEADELEARLGDPRLLVVDLGKPEQYAAGHIPGAVHADYAQLVTTSGSAKGMVPPDKELETFFSAIGLTTDRHVVAYDSEGCGRSARLLWTLADIGHKNFSLLNGGMQAWVAKNRALSTVPVATRPASFLVTKHDRSVTAIAEDILARIGTKDAQFVDCRTPAEFSGEKRLADRGGHIPGAVNFDWVLAMDQGNALCLRSDDWLRAAFAGLGITPDKEVIVYCQTHHRSAHTWVVLKKLGYPRVRGYAGSWSEWGNRPDLPVE